MGRSAFPRAWNICPAVMRRSPEQAALARVAQDAGGFYATHIRNEGDTLVESIAEALAVAEQSGVSLQLSHHKGEGRKNWGKVRTTLGMMADARAAGLDVLTDQYPYTAFMTGLGVILLPKWASDGSQEETTARLRDPDQSARGSSPRSRRAIGTGTSCRSASPATAARRRG